MSASQSGRDRQAANLWAMFQHTILTTFFVPFSPVCHDRSRVRATTLHPLARPGQVQAGYGSRTRDEVQGTRGGRCRAATRGSRPPHRSGVAPPTQDDPQNPGGYPHLPRLTRESKPNCSHRMSRPGSVHRRGVTITVFGLGGHLADSGVHIHGHRVAAGTATRGPGPARRVSPRALSIWRT